MLHTLISNTRLNQLEPSQSPESILVNRTGQDTEWFRQI
ncbi:hypothetical protein HHX47_DHR2001187 [Lentinula edodes]|nr:hypothetical protein HHX47_DHR2001187 [Lentinula edodes]